MKNNVTLKDIAEKIGVSSVTVSKAINNRGGVSEELKKKIKKIANDLGYQNNTVGKSTEEGLSYNIGVIIPERFIGDDQSPFYLKFHQYITRKLEEYNYYSILQILSNEDEQYLNLPRTYVENKVDGFIILGQIKKSYIELLHSEGIPKVFLDFYTDLSQVDTVVTDNFYGMYEMTNFLIQNGHKKIAFIGNIHTTSSIQDRFLGYYKSLLEHNIPLDRKLIIPDRDEEGKYIELDVPNPLPTAFVCNCDQIGFNFINKLSMIGYKVPEDCSVVGFDNDVYSTISKPPMTTTKVNIEDMSNAAVELIIDKLMKNGKSSVRKLIKGTIIHRESVKKI
ncbi:substrate-binding domain-containing protein [Bacillus sp. JCM 19034]|uniref:substrate-binding domain-containing protein n=1 Tax=Bacillus sp. JCM 19034 TaxID=1481928 RepID=UPI00078061C1|nr:substrate-binding domain-containing protein [Bacillus sp. JCM 19034]